MKHAKIVACLLLLSLTSCTAFGQFMFGRNWNGWLPGEREVLIQAETLDETHKALLANGIAWVGMTHRQLILAWNTPSNVITTRVAESLHQQLCYRLGGSKYKFAYLQNGVVVSLSTLR